MKKVYCKNCKNEKDKCSTYSIVYSGEYHKNVPASITGCGSEKFDIKETETMISIIPYRNRDNDCIHYERKWWKFWV